MSTSILGYHHLSRAWYAAPNIEAMKRHDPGYLDEVTFGLYGRTEDGHDDGCHAECTMKWILLGISVSTKEPTPELIMFSNSWRLFKDCPTLFKALAKVNDRYMTPAQFCVLLDRCGFKDLTALKYEDSYPNRL